MYIRFLRDSPIRIGFLNFSHVLIVVKYRYIDYFLGVKRQNTFVQEGAYRHAPHVRRAPWQAYVGVHEFVWSTRVRVSWPRLAAAAAAATAAAAAAAAAARGASGLLDE